MKKVLKFILFLIVLAAFTIPLGVGLGKCVVAKIKWDKHVRENRCNERL